MIGKIGDLIEWDFKNDTFNEYPEFLRGKTFTSRIRMIDLEDQIYGVYADYGQDLIPFNECKIIK
jgi:hypothetical protein